MNSKSLNSDSRYWILGILILLAFGRGIWALGSKSLWWDESLSLYRAEKSLAFVLSNQIILTDTVNRSVTIDNHPPLYFVLLWLAVRLFGHSEFALRFPSLFAVVLIVPLLYATGRRLVDERVGLVAAALGALSPMYLWYGQEARMYALLTFLSLLSFYCFIRAFFQPSGPVTFHRQGRWIGGSIVASACTVFTHYLGSLLIAFQLLGLAMLFLQQRVRRRALMATMAALIGVALASLIYAIVALPHATSRAGFRFIPLLELARDLLNSFSLGLSVNVADWPVLLIDLVFLSFLILGFIRLIRPGSPATWRQAGWLLTGYLLIPAVIVYVISYVQPAYMNSRHLIPITPPFYLLVAAGLIGRKQGARGRRQLFAVGCLLLAALAMAGGIVYSTCNYFRNPAYDKDHHREWGAYLREHVRPGDVVVVDPPHIAQLYQYYADSGTPWIGLPLLAGSRQETIAKLQELLNRYDRVWLALSHTPPWGDRRRLPEKWLNDNAFLLDYKAFESYASVVLVACYRHSSPSLPDLPADARPVEVRYSPSLRLRGYRLLSPPQPGRPLHIELYWAVDDQISEEASVQLRLVDSEGHVWGQGEQCPFNNLYPMWQWQPGLLLHDERELPIQPGTPPGTYQLELVLVSRPTEQGCPGEPGPVIAPALAPPEANRGDRVLLGTVQVPRAATPASLDDLAIEHRQQASFGGLDLLGVDLVPTRLVDGGRLSVTLYWQAQQGALPDAQFHLRAVDARGKVWQERPIRPVGDSYPADRWQAGDRFKGQFWLVLPEEAPAGKYRLELVPRPPLRRSGLGATIAHLLGRGEENLALGTIEVMAQESIAAATPLPTPAELSIAHPMLATLGEQVRFLGYTLETDTVRAGDGISFTLYWQALRPMNISYSVFTHLLGPEDRLVGQKDGLPRGGAYPTTLWQPGEVVADPYTFLLDPSTPPGRYPLEVGMYRLETDKRLPATDADGRPLPGDRILLSEITVLPASLPTPTVIKQRIYLPLVSQNDQ